MTLLGGRRYYMCAITMPVGLDAVEERLTSRNTRT